MIFGAVITTIAALLSRISSPLLSSGGRRGGRRRDRRIWRRSRRNHYRSRPQWRRPVRRGESTRSTTGPATVHVQAAEATRSEPMQRVDTADSERLGSTSNTANPSTSNQNIPPNTNLALSTDGNVSLASPTTSSIPSLHEPGTDKAASNLDTSNETDDMAGFIPNSSDHECEPEVLDVEVNSSSMEEDMNEESCCRPECVIPEDAGSAQEISAPKLSGSACSDLSVAVVAEKDSMSDNKSLKSGVRDSEKCLEMSSGLTNNSNSAAKSINSIKPRIAGGVSGYFTAQPYDQVPSVTEESIFPKAVDNISGKEQAAMRGMERFYECDSSGTDSQVQVVDSLSMTEMDIVSSDSFELLAADKDMSTCESSSEGSASDSTDGCGRSKARKKSRGDVFDRAEKNGIALEAIQMTVDGSAAVGTLLVRNDCYHKWVGGRHSTTGWASYQDTLAEWVESVEEGEFDRFEFHVEVPEQGSFHMELAFFCNQYWDNNGGENHVVSRTMLWVD